MPELKKFVTLKVSTSAMRTITKKGIYIFIREAEQKLGTKIL